MCNGSNSEKEGIVVNEKNYGIDALRMLAMFMVVSLHILTQGGDSKCIK